MTSPVIRVLGILTVLISFPMFLILAAIQRSRRSLTVPVEYVLIPPLSRGDGP